MKNLVINGDMRVDQRNEGASITCAGNTVRSVDKFLGMANSTGFFTLQKLAATPPIGFTNYLRLSTSNADAAPGNNAAYVMESNIEAFMCQAAGFGAATANSVSLSFWTRSSLTGLFSGAIRNAVGASTRAYPFSFTISAANTWTFIALTIPGDVTGAWSSSGSGIGINLSFNLGCGTNLVGANGIWNANNNYGVTGSVQLINTLNATLDFTGMQLEVASSATGFEYIAYEVQLAMCQRYYQKSFPQGNAPIQNLGINTGEIQWTASIAAAVTDLGLFIPFPVILRIAPVGKISTYNPAAANGSVRDETLGADCSGQAIPNVTDRGFRVSTTGAVGTSVGNTLGVHWTADADL